MYDNDPWRFHSSNTVVDFVANSDYYSDAYLPIDEGAARNHYFDDDDSLRTPRPRSRRVVSPVGPVVAYHVPN